MTRFAYVGTYTSTKRDEPHRKEGIFVYHVHPATGQLTLSSTAESGMNPSFLTIHPNRRNLFCANELTQGEVSSFAIQPVDGSLKRLNSQATDGMHPCFVSVDPSGKWLLTANYSSGSLAVFPILEGGALGPMSDAVQHKGALGPNKGRQERAHAHSVAFDPSGSFVLAADLGLDQVFVYRFDSEKGRLTPHGEGITANPGAGPRHFTFHAKGRFLYIANELDSTVTAFGWDAGQGSAETMHTLSTLPADFSGMSTVADIHLDGSGKYLLVSNRGHQSLAIFRVDAEQGTLVSQGWMSSGGNCPRNFGFDPSGVNLFAANQESDNVVFFRFDAQTGTAPAAGQAVRVPAPVCITFLDL
jgi:6-phosphogluconolactonase